MQINPITSNLYNYNRLSDNKSQQNFKGRLVSPEHLSKFGSRAMQSSLASQGVKFATGIQNGAWDAVNASLMAIGSGSCVTSWLMKNGERLNLKPNMTFVRAKNLDEAAKYAKENLKIKEFNIDDLEIANWMNEGLINLSNRFHGRTYMPANVKYIDFPKEECTLQMFTGARYKLSKDCIIINKYPYENIDEILENNLKGYSDEMMRIPFGEVERHMNFLSLIFMFKHNPESLPRTVKVALNTSVGRAKEIINQIFGPDKEKFSRHFDEISEELKKDQKVFNKNEPSLPKNIFGPVYCNKHQFIYHEAGHMFDFKSRSFFAGMMADKKNPKIFNQELQTLILPANTQKDYQEFSADVFAGIVDGDVYPERIMALFDKLNKIKLPK